MKDYKNIENFIGDGRNFVSIIKNLHPNISKIKLVEFARKYFNKSILNRCYFVGYLNSKQLNLLNTETSSVYFSLDSIIKNMIQHPEISACDYKNIDIILKKPDKIALSKSNLNSIILFKKNNKYYQAVIKTTKNKKENFLTSFRNLSEKEFNKY